MALIFYDIKKEPFVTILLWCIRKRNRENCGSDNCFDNLKSKAQVLEHLKFSMVRIFNG